MPDVELKFCAPQEGALSCGFPPDCETLCQEWTLWLDCVSASPARFSMGVFLFSQYVGIAQLSFEFLSEKIVLYIVVDLLCPWEEVS